SKNEQVTKENQRYCRRGISVGMIRPLRIRTHSDELPMIKCPVKPGLLLWVTCLARVAMRIWKPSREPECAK
ncbi:hypothetical protein A2U01_0095119, partial [Trifolium medium]|nr:hypothetical protein [Trifolium medium]